MSISFTEVLIQGFLSPEPVTDVHIVSNLPDPVEINSTVVLTCSAKGSFTYRWMNGSIPVVADGTHIKLIDNELIVSEVWRTDLRGPIYCIAENPLESGKSPTFNLTVSCKYINHAKMHACTHIVLSLTILTFL